MTDKTTPWYNADGSTAETRTPNNSRADYVPEPLSMGHARTDAEIAQMNGEVIEPDRGMPIWAEPWANLFLLSLRAQAYQRRAMVDAWQHAKGIKK